VTSGDTIAAISSAVGPAARMIVRLSGADARKIAAPFLDSFPATPSAFPSRLRLRGMTLPITVYLFLAPQSYTAEDLIEFHLPGNPLLCRMLLDDLTKNRARLAEPGEFTARAYFNGKIDLTAAEGVAAAISAHGEAELRAARQLLAGELARRLKPAMDLLAESLALVEAGIDFTDEGISFLPDADLLARIDQIQSLLCALIDQSARFDRLTHEPRLVLVGRPNAGKSTLLNALAGRERAVVSDIAGTTRDALSAEVPLRRGMVRLIDVAGIETSQAATDVDRQMQSRAHDELEAADFVVLICDASSPLAPLQLQREADLVVYSKADLKPGEGLAVSALTGQNMHLLRQRLDELAFGAETGGATLALNARHIGAINDATNALRRAKDAIAEGAEVVASELRNALDSIGQILGNVSPDDLLGRIFSTFCIGK
jgi:tRNA modification GTPase